MKTFFKHSIKIVACAVLFAVAGNQAIAHNSDKNQNRHLSYADPNLAQSAVFNVLESMANSITPNLPLELSSTDPDDNISITKVSAEMPSILVYHFEMKGETKPYSKKELNSLKDTTLPAFSDVDQYQELRKAGVDFRVELRNERGKYLGSFTISAEDYN